MVQLVISDVDGVLTNGQLNIGEDAELFKSFNVKDGYGIVRWQETGNEFVIVTSRESKAVTHRADELEISEVYQGVSDKHKKVISIAEQHNTSIDEVAYIGDDLSDVEALKKVGVGCCPADAISQVQSVCDYVSSSSGGDGAVRDILRQLQNNAKNAMGVIPARYGSTRLPGKPLKKICGKPMIQHVYEQASKATELDTLVVATDDDRIVAAVEDINGNAVLTDEGHPTGTHRVAEVAANKHYDITVNIQGDEPLISPAVIDSVVIALKESQSQVATPISPITDPAALDDENTVKVVTDSAGHALYFSRSRIPSGGTVGETFKHIGLYAFETEMLFNYLDMESQLEDQEDLEQLRLLEQGHQIQAVPVEYDGAEVNVESDLREVERIMEKRDDH